jgi:UDP-N-acetylmuramate dehydrogenase
MRWRSRLSREIQPLFSFDRSLSGMTTLGVGGLAECLARPETIRDLCLLLEFCRSEGSPLWIIGSGSNILAPDDGLPGIILQTSGLNGILWEEEGDSVLLYAESGVLLASLLGLSMKKGWSGLEFAAGIPGTLGGALSGNAGAGDLSIGGLVESVGVVGADGKIETKQAGDYFFSYRYSSIGEEGTPIIFCTLRLERSNPEYVADRTRNMLSRRNGQPKGVRTAGCIFKNPRGQSAGMLLDEAGCKGMSCGGAVVSRRHANFIENRGLATSRDVVSLIMKCAERVRARTGISLQREIRFLGDISDENANY